MRIESFLRASARADGEKPALITRDNTLTYAMLDALSDNLAGALAKGGVERGDRVIVFMDNCWQAAVAIFAVLKAGAVFSPINPSTKADKLAYVLNNCRARAVVTQAKLMPAAAQAISECRSVCLAIVAGDAAAGAQPPAAATDIPTLDFDAAAGASAAPPSHKGIDCDLAMLIYTSGSTGRPKGVMMTHRNVEAAATSIITYLEGANTDVILNVLPIAFDYGLYQLIMAIKLGATLVLEKSFAFPQDIFETMRRHRVTGLPLVPTMAALIVRSTALSPEMFPHLRYVTNTAAALPPAHIARLRELFPHARLYSMYGLTECKRCTYLPPEELDTRPGSVGIAIPGTEAFVLDETGRQVPPGVVGELVIRGPHVMQGYWEDDEATRRALRPGPNAWEKVLYTGDLFKTDREGFLYFVARRDDIIKTRGEKVAPKEVEAVLHACPGVAEAVVVGVPDPVLGQAVCAIVVAGDPSLTSRDVIHYCATHLEDFMVPRMVEFRAALPTTDTGKTSRRLAAQTLDIAS